MKINYNTLKQYCLMNIGAFESLGGKVDYTRDGILIHKDNNSKVLAVAHLDTVLNLKHFYVNRINKTDYIFNAQLDDRLGAYVICELLPSLGLNYDILLTEGEERGRSTARHFKPPRDYNWMFSFDRRGDDVVSYEYESKEWEKTQRSAGFRPANGSFSDICFLYHLGIRGLNIGTGYHGEHSDLCYADMDELKQQVRRFINFYAMYESTRFEYFEEEKIRSIPKGNFAGIHGIPLDDDIYYNDLACYLCKMNLGRHQIIDNIWVCDGCFGNADMCTVCDDVLYADQLTDGMCDRCREDSEWEAG